MLLRGKFIALEGIDGAGKHTQIEMLSRELKNRGIDHTCVSFPRYDGFFGRLVARFLNGEFGPLSRVDAHLSALLFAGDRFEAKLELETLLDQGKTILADRYVGSNLAHQTARVPARHRKEFLSWLEDLEYRIYALPEEDLVIFLRLPVGEAHRLVGKKAARHYTRRRRDIQEANLSHLKSAAGVYEILARKPNWVKIDCVQTKSRRLLPPEIIHCKVMEAVDLRIFSAAVMKQAGKWASINSSATNES